MAITLSILNVWYFSNFFTARKITKFATKPYNTSHHTFSMLLHYLAKVRSSNFGKSDTVRLLEQAMPAFIPLDLWPTNSPVLNSVDYTIWDIVQQRVYQSRVQWGAQHWWTDAAFAACLAWHWPQHHWQCNWRVVRAKDGHFEQLLLQYSAIWQERERERERESRFLMAHQHENRPFSAIRRDRHDLYW